MSDNVFERIKDFVQEESFVDNIILSRSIEIQKDLGIYGDDALEFFEKFSVKFNVDVSNFEIGKYFKGEGDPVLSKIVRFFCNNRPNDFHKVITLGDLERAVISGKLDSTVIEN